MIIAIIIGYFLLLLAVSRLAVAKGDNNSFFRGGRQSPWYMVAFGMVGASISGVTFVSVPGMVIHSDMSYLQTCMGFILGYFVVAFVLLPIYYRMNLTSIYTVLRGISDEAYKTGAAIFIFSKLLGSAAKFFVPCYIISAALGTNFYVTTVGLFLLIWLYTRRGGIKTLVWTDTVQTLCMLTALCLIMYSVYGELHFSGVGDCLAAVSESSYSRIFEFGDWNSPHNFFKCFISGIFIVIVMTGLDQDMMQKNLTCKTLRDAQKDMCTYGFAFVPVNALFLILGIMLTMLYAKEGIALPERADELMVAPLLFPQWGDAQQYLLALFIIGIMSTSFSTVDSSLTALTTSFCVDILMERGTEVRKRVHIGMTIALILCTMAFGLFSTSSLIDTIYRLVSYTYGPLLGLFAFALTQKPLNTPLKSPRFSSGMTHKGETPSLWEGKGWVPLVCLLSPLICFVLDIAVPRFTGYHFGYELLLINGAITYVSLKLVIRN